MGRSVSNPVNATWVLYTHLRNDDRQVFVCRKCEHTHYDLEEEPAECAECGNVGFRSYPESDPELEWEDFMDNLKASFKASFPSLRDCDRWIGREDHAVLENKHALIGVSEYCGLISVWCVHKEHDGHQYDEGGLHEHWASSIEAKAERILEDFSERLVPTCWASNGERGFQRVTPAEKKSA